MKVAFVSEHASPLAVVGGVDAGGQNVHVAELAKALSILGHQITVFTRRDDPKLPDQVTTADGYAVRHLDAGPPQVLAKDELWPHMPQFADRLRQALTVEIPDVVHGHFWMSVWAAQRAGHLLEVPTVATFHALGTVKRRHQREADTSPSARLAVESELASSVDRIVATCSDEVTELRVLTSVPAAISVVPCGVDVASFRPDGPESTDSAGRRRLVALGRLVPRKGFATLIEALPRLAGVELVIAGGGAGPEPERDRLRTLADRHGVADRVQLLPQLPRHAVPALLRSADVVVCVPWYEPFGIVPLEAMACGRPVVASAVGGMLDTVIPGHTGALVPPKDPAAVADAVHQLLDDPARREQYGRNGVEWIHSRYTWERVAEQTVEAYRRTVGARPSRSPLTVIGA
ncbi:MAG: glycosyltransferase [Microlunatus sp.]|nr:glycosyltransferase [Microlunatus sp.]